MAGTTWPSLVAGRKAKASEVEAKFDWIEGSIVPQNSGSTTDLAYDLGTSTARWRGLWVGGINPTTTAGGVAVGTTTVANGSVGLELAGTTKAMLVSRLTAAQRNALTAINGMVIYNSDDAVFNIYENGAWTTMGQKIGITAKTSASYVVSSGASLTTMTILDFSGSGRLLGIAVDSGDDRVDFNNFSIIVDSVSSAIAGPTSGAGSFRIELDGRETSTTFCAANYTSGAQPSILMPTPVHFKSQLKVYWNAVSSGMTSTIYVLYEKS